jgi:hypothetical protein
LFSSLDKKSGENTGFEKAYQKTVLTISGTKSIDIQVVSIINGIPQKSSHGSGHFFNKFSIHQIQFQYVRFLNSFTI